MENYWDYMIKKQMHLIEAYEHINSYNNLMISQCKNKIVEYKEKMNKENSSKDIKR